MRKKTALALVLTAMIPNLAIAAPNVQANDHKEISDKAYETQFGPQSPRDIDVDNGKNPVIFSKAPPSSVLNLCNIHFHKNAEHRGGEFTKPVNSSVNEAGFLYTGQLNKSELMPYEQPVCKAKGSGLKSGDTIELHYVYSTAPVKPGETLGACLTEHINNPQLRVEAQVMVLTNDGNGQNFNTLAEFEKVNGYYQAVNLSDTTSKPVEYTGSTTGPSYNDKGSPFKVTWSVRPKVLKTDIKSLGKWCEQNTFNEHAAHDVRNLVTNPQYLSPILN
ncbi:hypothetical protein PSECIP111951_00059 [Pseudoalteromonas holothuriae]|uniref:Cadmium carbonic anhydrase n=1 Tax=Pseudoalteromonas holothuriae TaxID=2963714 RepID=A0ABM9GEQ3_9GAMM|nr:delta-class carbonic anhydrase [Pseudoalteromonas sp. CIP111951]CAH9049866.1 hypothetical protein PSECIP111951_00059 [Pseudoalteromonas sp. CIP111951]